MLTKNDLKQIEQVVTRIVDVRIGPLDKKIRQIDGKIRQMDRKVDVILNYFDNKYLDHESRLERIEKHLQFS